MSAQNRKKTFGMDAWRRSPKKHNDRVAYQKATRRITRRFAELRGQFHRLGTTVMKANAQLRAFAASVDALGEGK